MNQAAMLAKFRRESLSTASPAKLLTMLFDRLLLDLDRAAAAMAAREYPTVNEQLSHAQQIIHELRCALDVDAWDGAPQLMELYNYAYAELVTANVQRDADKIAEIRALIEPLRDAWNQAAASTTASPATAAAFG